MSLSDEATQVTHIAILEHDVHLCLCLKRLVEAHDVWVLRNVAHDIDLTSNSWTALIFIASLPTPSVLIAVIHELDDFASVEFPSRVIVASGKSDLAKAAFTNWLVQIVVTNAPSRVA